MKLKIQTKHKLCNVKIHNWNTHLFEGYKSFFEFGASLDVKHWILCESFLFWVLCSLWTQVFCFEIFWDRVKLLDAHRRMYFSKLQNVFFQVAQMYRLRHFVLMHRIWSVTGIFGRRRQRGQVFPLALHQTTHHLLTLCSLLKNAITYRQE